MLTVVIVGTGNVARHLYRAMAQTVAIGSVRVWGRDSGAARHFEKGAFFLDASEFPQDPALVLLAVSDDAIAMVSERLERLPVKKALIVHTSGGTPMEVLARHTRYGVLYPLQTFSGDRELDFGTVPLCIEAHTPENREQLRDLARSLSKNVYTIDSEKRRWLHLAAVFANNFTNHLYGTAQALCEEQGVPFDILRPLIRETAAKVMDRAPYDMQTGPARRGDDALVERQHALLADPDQRAVYRVLTESIRKTYGS